MVQTFTCCKRRRCLALRVCPYVLTPRKTSHASILLEYPSRTPSNGTSTTPVQVDFLTLFGYISLHIYVRPLIPGAGQPTAVIAHGNWSVVCRKTNRDERCIIRPCVEIYIAPLCSLSQYGCSSIVRSRNFIISTYRARRLVRLRLLGRWGRTRRRRGVRCSNGPTDVLRRSVQRRTEGTARRASRIDAREGQTLPSQLRLGGIRRRLNGQHRSRHERLRGTLLYVVNTHTCTPTAYYNGVRKALQCAKWYSKTLFFDGRVQ